MKKMIMTLAASAFIPAAVFAHGGDKAGPHGGNVEMPGPFHTELVMDENQEVMVYLLDMNFANPVIQDSSVAVQWRNKKDSVSFKCAPMHNHFHCIPEKKFPLTGELAVHATRAKAKGNEAVYKLPLRFR